MGYEAYLNRKQTPQQERFRNNAGGYYVFKIDPYKQLERFLALGTTGGTYYVGERKLTEENLELIERLLDDDYELVLDLTADMSKSGRIVKNDPAIVVLAMALSHRKTAVRRYAEEVFHEIIRIPTHLFTLMKYLRGMRGHGRLIRRVVSKWYLNKSIDNLVYHVLKYQQRGGWSHKDVLKLVHVKPPTKVHEQLFGWIVGKKSPPEHPLIEAFIKLRKAKELKEVLGIIREYNVTWEFVPTEWLNKAEVWVELLPKLPFMAMVRNLGRMSACGALGVFSDEARYVAERLINPDIVKNSKIHPIQAAVAAKTYYRGAGIKGKLQWTVDSLIVDALEEMVMLSFENVEQTGRRFLLALDVSRSMTWYTCCEGVLNCMEGAAIMALATVRAENRVHTCAFSTNFQPLPIGKRDTINSVYEKMERLNFGATYCAIPMLYALENKIPVDVFVIYTDNETWYGRIHPCQALDQYRNKMGIPAKLAVVGMVSTGFSIADPQDPFQLDFVGFDTATPQAIAEFAKL